MKMKEIPYFTRSVDRAEKRFADYKARTEAQARNLGFVCAGNLGKGSRNRLNTITDKSVRLYSAYTLRRLFLKMYRLEDNGTRIFWAELNDILRICQTEASLSIITIIRPLLGTIAILKINTTRCDTSSTNTARQPTKNIYSPNS